MTSDPKHMVGLGRGLNQPPLRRNPVNRFAEDGGTSRKHCRRGSEITHRRLWSLGSSQRNYRELCSQLIIQGISNRSVNMPNRSAQKVFWRGMRIEPPAESSWKIRSASSTSFTLIEIEKP